MAAMYLSHGHGGHHAGGVALAALWLGLAGYFGWHAAASVGRVRQAWVGVPAGKGALVAPRGPTAVGGTGRARRDERPDGGDVPHRALIRGRPESLHELGRIADVGRSAPSTRRSRRRTSSARVRARSRRSLWVGRRRAPGGAGRPLAPANFSAQSRTPPDHPPSPEMRGAAGSVGVGTLQTARKPRAPHQAAPWGAGPPRIHGERITQCRHLLFCHALLRRIFTAVLLLVAVVVLAHDPRPAVDLTGLLVRRPVGRLVDQRAPSSTRAPRCTGTTPSTSCARRAAAPPSRRPTGSGRRSGSSAAATPRATSSCTTRPIASPSGPSPPTCTRKAPVPACGVWDW